MLRLQFLVLQRTPGQVSSIATKQLKIILSHRAPFTSSTRLGYGLDIYNLVLAWPTEH